LARRSSARATAAPSLAEYRGGNRLLNSTEWAAASRPSAGLRSIRRASLADQAKAVAGVVTPSGFIEDAAFVKLRELSLTYTAPCPGPHASAPAG